MKYIANKNYGQCFKFQSLPFQIQWKNFYQFWMRAPLLSTQKNDKKLKGVSFLLLSFLDISKTAFMNCLYDGISSQLPIISVKVHFILSHSFLNVRAAKSSHQLILMVWQWAFHMQALVFFEAEYYVVLLLLNLS